MVRSREMDKKMLPKTRVGSHASSRRCLNAAIGDEGGSAIVFFPVSLTGPPVMTVVARMASNCRSH